MPKTLSTPLKTHLAGVSTAETNCARWQLATKHGIHPTMVSEWKRQATEGLTVKLGLPFEKDEPDDGETATVWAVFSERLAAREVAKSTEAEVEKLHAKRLTNCWWNGIFWRRRPVDERGPAEGPELTKRPSGTHDTVQNLGVVMPLSETDAEPIVLRRHDRDRSSRWRRMCEP